MSTPDSLPPALPENSPNPYAVPSSEIVGSHARSGSPANPWMRLLAQIIDGVILFPVSFLASKLLYTPDLAAVNAAVMRGDTLGAVSAATPPFYIVLLTNVIVIAALIAINWKFLPKGQTIGKKVLGLQIQSRDGSLFPVNTLITKRMLPYYVAAAVPVIGAILVIIDALCIFRAGRNTLHDDYAQSKVIIL